MGPVLLRRGDNAFPTRSALLRTLLALLALEAGKVISASVLIDELWGVDLPQDPKSALQIQASRLRKWLSAAGLEASALRNEHDGYVLDIRPNDVDLLAFLTAAPDALRETPASASSCATCLAMYTGELFGGCVLSLRLDGERLRATELRLQLVQRHAEALIAAGRYDDAVGALVPVMSTHRDREQLTMLAMTALYRAGRQHEALAAYAETRRYLIDEFGIEPGPALTRLERSILTQAPELDGEPSDAEPTSRTIARPVILGRDDELAMIGKALRGGNGGHVVVVQGEAGAGKTTLVQAVLHDARMDGASVAAGAWDDDGAPLSAWDAALTELGVGATAAAGRDGAVVSRAVRGALAGLALDTPVLVALEDAHFADSMSLGVLRGVVRLGLPPNVTLLVTARHPDVTAHPQWSATHADISGSPAVTTLTLGDLSRAATLALAELLLDQLDADAAKRIGEFLWELSGGHALHLTALIDAMTHLSDESACRAAASAVPSRLQPLLSHQLLGLPRDCRDALETMAVVGPTSMLDLAKTLGIEVVELSRRVRPAIESGLVHDQPDRVGLRHALTAQAVLDGMPAATRQVLHRARYDALRSAGGDPFEVLRQAAGAGALVAPGELAGARLAAGQAAYARGALAEAAALLDAIDADALSDDDALLVTLWRGLAAAALGYTDDADQLLDSLTSDPAAPTDVVVTAAVGHQPLGLRVNGDPRRLARLERAYNVTTGYRSAARLEVLRALVVEEQLAFGRPRTDSAVRELTSLARAFESDDLLSRAHVAVMSARDDVEAPIVSTARLASAEAAYDLSAAAGDPVLHLDAIELLMAATLAAGDDEEAEDLRWELTREGAHVGRPRATWAARVMEASLLLARGETAAADEVASSALQSGLDVGIPDAFGAFGVHSVVKGLLVGGLGALAPFVVDAVEAYPHIAAWRAAAALTALHNDEPADARKYLADYAECRAVETSRLFDRAGLCLAAMAALALGDKAVGDLVLAALPPDPRATVVVGVGAGILGPVNLAVALAETTIGSRAEATAHVAEAIVLATKLGWKPWAAAGEVLAARLTGAPTLPFGLPAL